MGKRKGISSRKKIEAVEKYKRGEGSQESIAREYGIEQSSFSNGSPTMKPWVHLDLAPQRQTTDTVWN